MCSVKFSLLSNTVYWCSDRKRRGAINSKQLTYLEKYRPKQRLRYKHPHIFKSKCCIMWPVNCEPEPEPSQTSQTGWSSSLNCCLSRSPSGLSESLLVPKSQRSPYGVNTATPLRQVKGHHRVLKVHQSSWPFPDWPADIEPRGIVGKLLACSLCLSVKSQVVSFIQPYLRHCRLLFNSSATPRHSVSTLSVEMRWGDL